MEGKEGLKFTDCACAIIMQILSNLITYGCMYLPFDLNSSHSIYGRLGQFEFWTGFEGSSSYITILIDKALWTAWVRILRER